jgi:hypothetical protein
MLFAELITLFPLVALYAGVMAVMIVAAIVLSILARRREVREMHRMRQPMGDEVWPQGAGYQPLDDECHIQPTRPWPRQ